MKKNKVLILLVSILAITIGFEILDVIMYSITGIVQNSSLAAIITAGIASVMIFEKKEGVK